MRGLFFSCKSLEFLPDISKWNSNVKDLSYLFYKLTSLKSSPDISKWCLSKVNNMENMFAFFKSLSFIPNISEWDMSNPKYMIKMFYGCSSLSEIDISKWNLESIFKDGYFFYGGLFDDCISLSYKTCLYNDDIFKNCFNIINEQKQLIYKK